MPRDARGPRRGLLCLGAAFLLVVSFPPFSVVPAPFVALAPLAVWVARAPTAPVAARAGLWTGLGAWAALVYWVPTTLGPVTGGAWLFYGLLVALLAAFVALAVWLTHRLHHGAGVPLPLALGLGWTAAEWLRAHLGPLSFPWLELGVSLAPWPALAGPAELVGVRGLSFWLAVSGGLAAVAAGRGGRRWAALLLWVAVPAAWGAWRMTSLELVPTFRVAVVQPNLLPDDHGRSLPDAEALTRLASLSLQALDPEADVDLVVWPEASLRADPRGDSTLAAGLDRTALALGVPLVLGAYLDEPGPSGTRTYNGVLAWRPGAPGPGEVYHKRRLVPGVESVPFLTAGAGGQGVAGGFARGGEGAPLEVEGLPPMATLVCYESLFAPDARALAADGRTVLLNVTNDAWFGGRRGRNPTWALEHHPAHLVLRAVELRTGAVRAANTGISMVVDPLGRVSGATPTFQPRVLVGQVHTTRGRTVFARVGDVVGWGSALSAAVLVLTVGWRGRGLSRGSRRGA